MGGWNFIDRTNMRWGKLVAIKYLGNKIWLCHCDCGNDCEVSSDRLPINKERRYQKSCGCLNKSHLIGDINYFNNINSSNKAYILGILASDGTITNNIEKGTYTLKLVFNVIDTELLIKIKEEINTQAEVKTYKTKTSLPQGGYCESEMSSLLLCSKEMVEDVIKYGITPNKSLTLSPNYDLIPKEFWKDFWRGYIDGDGTFGIYSQKKILQLSFVSSKLMAESTKEKILSIFPDFKIGIYKKPGANENTKQVTFTNQQQMLIFLDYIYENSCLYLERKYKNYLKIKEYYN